MRFMPLFLVLSLVLLTAFSTPAAAPSTRDLAQQASVTSLTDSKRAEAAATAPARHTVRMKAVSTTYSRPLRQTRDLKPVSQAPASPQVRTASLDRGTSAGEVVASNPVAPRFLSSRSASPRSEASGSVTSHIERPCEPQPSGQRAPLSLQRTPPDNRQVASLSARRLLELAQRDLTAPRGPVQFTV